MSDKSIVKEQLFLSSKSVGAILYGTISSHIHHTAMLLQHTDS